MTSDNKPPLTPGYDDSKIEDISSEEGVDAQIQDPERVAEEKALVRKLDGRILPFACLLYLFACEFSTAGHQQ